MAQKIVEGQTAIVMGDSIEYPSVSSCFTITCVDKRGRMAGGHAVVAPSFVKGQWDFEKIVDFIKTAVPKDQRAHLLLLGDTSGAFWKGKGGWQGIANSFGIPMDEELLTCMDKDPYVKAGSVDIVVSPTGDWQFWKTGAEKRGAPIVAGRWKDK